MLSYMIFSHTHIHYFLFDYIRVFQALLFLFTAAFSFHIDRAAFLFGETDAIFTYDAMLVMYFYDRLHFPPPPPYIVSEMPHSIDEQRYHACRQTGESTLLLATYATIIFQLTFFFMPLFRRFSFLLFSPWWYFPLPLLHARDMDDDIMLFFMLFHYIFRHFSSSLEAPLDCFLYIYTHEAGHTWWWNGQEDRGFFSFLLMLMATAEMVSLLRRFIFSRRWDELFTPLPRCCRFSSSSHEVILRI